MALSTITRKVHDDQRSSRRNSRRHGRSSCPRGQPRGPHPQRLTLFRRSCPSDTSTFRGQAVVAPSPRLIAGHHVLPPGGHKSVVFETTQDRVDRSRRQSGDLRQLESVCLLARGIKERLEDEACRDARFARLTGHLSKSTLAPGPTPTPLTDRRRTQVGPYGDACRPATGWGQPGLRLTCAVCGGFACFWRRGMS